MRILTSLPCCQMYTILLHMYGKPTLTRKIRIILLGTILARLFIHRLQNENRFGNDLMRAPRPVKEVFQNHNNFNCRTQK